MVAELSHPMACHCQRSWYVFTPITLTSRCYCSRRIGVGTMECGKIFLTAIPWRVAGGNACQVLRRVNVCLNNTGSSDFEVSCPLAEKAAGNDRIGRGFPRVRRS